MKSKNLCCRKCEAALKTTLSYFDKSNTPDINSKEARNNRQAWINELRNVWESCKLNDWDGFGALAVPKECFDLALALIRLLPPEILKPSFGAEPDGELTMEWHHSTYRTISISVTKYGFLHYSAIFGKNTFENGTEAFHGKLPAHLIALIHQVCK